MVGLLQLVVSLSRIGRHLLNQLMKHLLTSYLDVDDLCVDVGGFQVFGAAGVTVEENEVHRRPSGKDLRAKPPCMLCGHVVGDREVWLQGNQSPGKSLLHETDEWLLK